MPAPATAGLRAGRPFADTQRRADPPTSSASDWAAYAMAGTLAVIAVLRLA